jgi:hypothetical protein
VTATAATKKKTQNSHLSGLKQTSTSPSLPLGQNAQQLNLVVDGGSLNVP